MLRLFNKSLLLRLGLAMATITGLAFVGMLSSVIIADISEGQAAAINQAGTLRMQSYRIASDLAFHTLPLDDQRLSTTRNLVDEFEQRLTDIRLTGVLAKSMDRPLHAAYDTVSGQWQSDIKPLLNAFLDAASNKQLDDVQLKKLRMSYLSRVDKFVEKIDHLVQVLETEAETNIQWLRLIQVVSLFLTLAVVLVTMYFVNTRVISQLQELLSTAKAARRGDFSQRTTFQSDDELGELGATYNLMAEDLSKMYTGLETRVREKTSDLERSNRSLELLYNATRRLIESPLSNDVYEHLLRDIRQLTGVGPGSICLGNTQDNIGFKLASTLPDTADSVIQLCGKADCKKCFGLSSDAHVVDITSHPGNNLYSVPIKDAEQQYGVLVVELPATGKLETWQERLLEAVASHIAVALRMAQHSSELRLIALLEERSVMARELHDSLAQSLSYLKIQVSRLDAAISGELPGDKVREITGELRDGLNSAYRELRELLTTFRLKINAHGINRALELTVEEFRERSTTDITLNNHLGSCQLGANAEIHLIQIIREALSNVVQHSRARKAVVSTSCDPNGSVIIIIEDDGIGMPDEMNQRHHYGLAIMRERAQSLNGELAIHPSKSGGTCVELQFNTSAISRDDKSQQIKAVEMRQ